MIWKIDCASRSLYTINGSSTSGTESELRVEREYSALDESFLTRYSIGLSILHNLSSLDVSVQFSVAGWEEIYEIILLYDSTNMILPRCQG